MISHKIVARSDGRIVPCEDDTHHQILVHTYIANPADNPPA